MLHEVASLRYHINWYFMDIYIYCHPSFTLCLIQPSKPSSFIVLGVGCSKTQGKRAEHHPPSFLFWKTVPLSKPKGYPCHSECLGNEFFNHQLSPKSWNLLPWQGEKGGPTEVVERERIGLILFTGASWSPRKCLQYYKNWSRQQNQRQNKNGGTVNLGIQSKRVLCGFSCPGTAQKQQNHFHVLSQDTPKPKKPCRRAWGHFHSYTWGP